MITKKDIEAEFDKVAGSWEEPEFPFETVNRLQEYMVNVIKQLKVNSISIPLSLIKQYKEQLK